MASKYFDDIKGYPTKGIVMEDSVWVFGEPKEKAKINIPVLLPLQEPAETTKYVKNKSNAAIQDKNVEQTLNYVELYLPDSVYTFPTDYEVENEEPEIRGASKENPKRTEKNGETKPGLVRVVKKNTRLMLFIIDGIAISDNIKILGRYDDFEEPAEEQEMIINEKPGPKSINGSTIKSGTRSGWADRSKQVNKITDKQKTAMIKSGATSRSLDKTTKRSALNI